VFPKQYQLDDCTFSTPTRMPSEPFNQALKTFIRVCADIVLYNPEKKLVYLAKRISCFPKWWVIGGQIHPGESEHIAAQRCLKRETSLKVEKWRLHFLCLNRYFHAGLPNHPARDNLTYVFGLPIINAELQQATTHLDPDEYDTSLGLKPFDKQALLNNALPQPLIDTYHLLFPNRE
jgi:hypothetical protein